MTLTREFKKLLENTKRDYLGKPVPTRFQKLYGKKYNIKDIKPKSHALAKIRGIQIEKFNQMVKGGEK